MRGLQVLARRFTTSAVARNTLRSGLAEGKGTIPAESGYASTIIKRQQQVSDQSGTIVWQLSAMDKMAYSITSVVATIGTLGMVYLLWQMSWPKKKSE